MRVKESMTPRLGHLVGGGYHQFQVGPQDILFSGDIKLEFTTPLPPHPLYVFYFLPTHIHTYTHTFAFETDFPFS